MNEKLYGGIEAGGTKFVCAVGASPDKIIDKLIVPTTSPAETLKKVTSFFKRWPALQSIGIASFGPIDLDRRSKTYGFITTTPKKAWQHVGLLGYVERELGVRAVIDTDVNGAALGEQLYGAARGLDSVAYMTVGTGIGLGLIANGALVKGLNHIEAGHMLIPRVRGDERSGACLYHHDCLESLASGTALQLRWGQPARDIHDDEAWALEAQYLAYGLTNVIFTVMPERIIMGGGVMQHAGLIENVRGKVKAAVHGYVELPEVDHYIVAPGLGGLSGVTGAIYLARTVQAEPHRAV